MHISKISTDIFAISFKITYINPQYVCMENGSFVGWIGGWKHRWIGGWKHRWMGGRLTLVFGSMDG